MCWTPDGVVSRADLSVHIVTTSVVAHAEPLSHLFGDEADSEQLLRTVLGLQDGTESLSMMPTFKKRKLANAADDEQQ